MTRQELAIALSAIERALDDRVEVWRIVVDARGNELRRIFRCSFQRPPSVNRLNRK